MHDYALVVFAIEVVISDSEYYDSLYYYFDCHQKKYIYDSRLKTIYFDYCNYYVFALYVLYEEVALSKALENIQVKIFPLVKVFPLVKNFLLVKIFPLVKIFLLEKVLEICESPGILKFQCYLLSVIFE